MGASKAFGTFLLLLHMGDYCHAGEPPLEERIEDGICTIVIRSVEPAHEAHLQNCEVWVRYRFNDPEYYEDVILETLESNPPETHDAEALDALNHCLSGTGTCTRSYQKKRTKELPGKCGMFKTYTHEDYNLSSIIEESGRKMKQFDYFKGCQEPEYLNEET